MTSEPRTAAPFRMPEGLFAELAVGGGSAQALAFLERSERARRMLLLRTLLDHLDALPTPLTPAADAWRVLKDAAERAPGPVERLLLAPATGGWLAHVLRRVHGTASGPPLWVEAGHLCALAVTASLRAGTAAELRVPLTDGALSLPGLGQARLPEAPAGWTAGVAATSRGTLTLTGPGRHSVPTTLTCRPATEPLRSHRAARVPVPGYDNRAEVSGTHGGAEAEVSGTHGRGEGAEGPATWYPLRTLTHIGRAGVTAIPLDDLDPYRDLDDPVPPARLDADEAEEWQRLFDDAVGILATPAGTGPGRVDPAAIRAVVPFGRTGVLPPAPPAVPLSGSSGDSYGAMVIARPACAPALAETLVHEFQHSKLAALLHLFPLLDDDREERHYAPWRADPRHLTGLLHGAYAFTGVAGFWRDRLAGPYHSEKAGAEGTGGEETGIEGTGGEETGAEQAGHEQAGRDEVGREEAGYHFALRRLQSRLVVRALLTSGRLTAPGRAFVSGLARTLDGWLREPVPETALARARTAAALHRTEWRLRNVDPAGGSLGGAHRFRPDRTLWPDVRTQAFATRPAVPRTADEYLAAGRPAAALARYEDALADDPAEPHTLAGWIVARATLAPGRTARRILARPELLRPSGG
ncbi:HEXXH motif domain-containing protein [Streptomyces sp. NPDC048297]|uniref:HEXXH motif domain-containing protein n=1 Tax=Streptomyces sp. NPDC048297 TaxID=3365531 RepID=UPI0037211809